MLALAWQVTSAVEHLHSKGVVHGDIKASNIMLTATGAAADAADASGTADAAIKEAQAGGGGSSGGRLLHKSRRRPSLTAKLGDFGNSRLLGGVLGPSDGYGGSVLHTSPPHTTTALAAPTDPMSACAGSLLGGELLAALNSSHGTRPLPGIQEHTPAAPDTPHPSPTLTTPSHLAPELLARTGGSLQPGLETGESWCGNR